MLKQVSPPCISITFKSKLVFANDVSDLACNSHMWPQCTAASCNIPIRPSIELLLFVFLPHYRSVFIAQQNAENSRIVFVYVMCLCVCVQVHVWVRARAR